MEAKPMIIHHEKVNCRCHNCDRKTSDVGISMGSEKTRYRFVLYLCDDCAKQILRGLLGLPDDYDLLIHNLYANASILAETAFGAGIAQDCREAAEVIKKLSGKVISL